MAWRHPFITIDQNQLRNPDTIARVVDECCRNGLRILLPDGAFLEFSKGKCPFETARHSLQALAPHRELVCSSRKLTEMLREEFARHTPCGTLVHEDATEELRTMLAEMELGTDTTLRKLVDGPIAEMMPPSFEVWNDHDKNREIVQSLHDSLRTVMPPDLLKAFRRDPKKGVSDLVSSENGMGFVLQYLKARGMDDKTAYELTRTPSVSAGFLSAIVGLAAYWLAWGGLTKAAAKQSSGDLNDIEYIVLGALSRSLATEDQRAAIICQAVENGFEIRQRLPRWVQ